MKRNARIVMICTETTFVVWSFKRLLIFIVFIDIDQLKYIRTNSQQTESKQNQIGLLICYWVDLNGSLSLTLFLNFIDGNYELVCTTNNIFYGVRFWILDIVYDNTRL